MSNLLAVILNAIPFPAIFVDQSERIFSENQEAHNLIGKHIHFRHYATILRQPSILSSVESCLRDMLPKSARVLINYNQRDRIFFVTCRFIAESQYAEHSGVLIIFQDVTQLEEAGNMQRDFVANVSHELRSPLTSLIGFIETLKGSARKDSKTWQHFLEMMEVETNRMNRLVSDLLSLSCFESQQLNLDSKVDIMGVLNSTLHSLQPVLSDAKINLKLKPVKKSIEIFGDSDQLQQVFSNLIENAVKYGSICGKVTIRISEYDDDEVLQMSSVRISISDNGPGIDPIHLPRLTERFYRADNHRSRELGGTGLGLAIVKHIISRHKGRLLIESELGEGANFTVILPK